MCTLRWFRSHALAWLAGALLAGCGGGVYVGWSDFDNLPPDVSLATSTLTALPGDSVRLVAAAADESGIDHVSFYRYDGNTAVRVGSDYAPPYEWALTVPDDGRASVTVFARAVDSAGNVADSRSLTIAITL